MGAENGVARHGRPVPFPDPAGGTVPDGAVRDLAELFRALGDRTRVHILFLLVRHGELNVTRIGEEVGQSQPAVSHHLNQLKKSGLIAFRRDGKFNFYRLADGGLGELAATLFPGAAAPRLRLGPVEVTFPGA